MNNNPASIRSRFGTFLGPWLLSLVALLGCGKTIEQSQSQTHWLARCSDGADCGALECICGRCILACDDARACGDSPTSTECYAATSEAASDFCDGASQAPVPICLEPCGGDCGSARSLRTRSFARSS
jgi:hypothetical protein